MSHIESTTPVVNDAELEALVADLIPLIDNEQAAKWEIGDLLVERVHGSGGPVPLINHSKNGRGEEFRKASEKLAEKGRYVTEDTLRDRYRTSMAFPEGDRYPTISWSTHYEVSKAGPTPEALARMDAFIAHCDESGTKPSRRNAREFLGMHVPDRAGKGGAITYLQSHPEEVADVVSEVVDQTPEVLDNVVRKLPHQVAESVAKDDVASDAVIEAIAKSNQPTVCQKPPKPQPRFSIMEALADVSASIDSLIADSVHEHPEGFGVFAEDHAKDVDRFIGTLAAFAKWLRDPSKAFWDPNGESFDITTRPLFVSDIVGNLE